MTDDTARSGPPTVAPAGDDVELYAPPPERRSFAPTDVLRLVIGAIVIAVGALIAGSAQSTIAGLEADLLAAFSRFPDSVENSILSLAQLVTGAVPTVVLLFLLWRRRFKLVLILVAATIIASYGVVVADAIVLDEDLSALVDQLTANDTSGAIIDESFPNSNALASTTAIVVIAGQFLSRRWKRTLWWMIAILVFLRLVAVAHPAFDFVLALGVGLFTGSLILLLFGSPSTEPRPAELLAALRGAGFRPRRIDRPEDQDGQAIRYQFIGDDDRAHRVTLRTPDERDGDALSRLYQNIRYRSSEVANAYGSIKRRIEHEALVLSLADRAGVRVDRVERIGTTAGGSAFLVTTPTPTRRIEPDDLETPGLLEDLWRQLGALHDTGLAHRGLSLEALRIDDGGAVRLTDFDQARTAADEREQARDIAELLVETAVVVGATPAVSAAVDAIGVDAVAPSLRMLQPLALPSATRARAGEEEGLLDALRDEVNRLTGEPGLELEELERIKPRTVLIVAASTLAFYSLLPQLANLQSTVDAFGNANVAWIAAAILASSFTYLFAAIAFQGAVADRIPFAPNVRAQLAASFAGLVGPGGAGGFALTARFLERMGVKGAEAGASVAVNAIAGAVVHVSLMIGFFVWTGSADIGGFSLPKSSTVFLLLAAVLTIVGLLLLIRPIRTRVVGPLVDGVKTALGQIGRVFQDPTRVVTLFGGSVGITLTYLAGVMASVQAFGGGLSLAQVGAAYLGAVTIATVSPTPGGLGALESAMIAGFTGFGLDAGVAVSATLTFRLATFWLPILPGWATLGWMQRNDEL